MFSNKPSAAGSQEMPLYGSDPGPAWAREAAISIRSRPSRASSIRSTWTKTSITTLQEDAPWWSADNQYSHSRDSPLLESWTVPRILASPGTPTQSEIAPPDYDGISPSEDFFTTPTRPVSQHQSVALSHRATRSDSAPPEVTLNPVRDSAVGINRDQSFSWGREDISVHRRHASSGAVPSIGPPISQAQPSGHGSPGTNLRRRNGLKIKTRPSLDHTGQSISPLTPYSGRSPNAGTPRNLTPAGATRGEEYEPSSPAYLGRGATGTFPSPSEFYANGPIGHQRGRSSEGTIIFDDDRANNGHIAQTNGPNGVDQNEGGLGKTINTDEGVRKGQSLAVSYPDLLTVAPTPAHIEEGDMDTHPPPPMDTDNDIMIHYTRLVRKLDKNYQNEIQTREDEIGETRAMIRELAEEVASLKAQIKVTGLKQSKTEESAPPVRSSNALQAKQGQSLVYRLPPLSRSNVRIIRNALGRRADKLRRKGDEPIISLHDLKESPKSFNPFRKRSSCAEATREASLSIETAASGVGAQPAKMEELTPQSTSTVAEVNSQNRSLRADVVNLQATVETLRSSLDFWTTRCESLERQREEDLARQTEELFAMTSSYSDNIAGQQDSVDVCSAITPDPSTAAWNESSGPDPFSEQSSRLTPLSSAAITPTTPTDSTNITTSNNRAQLTELEKQQLSAIARARHAVEDMWEVRWKDRDRQLLDRMRRIELESQLNIERAVAERDEEWAAAWAKKNRQVLQNLQVREDDVCTLKRQLRMAMRALNYGIDTDEVYAPVDMEHENVLDMEPIHQVTSRTPLEHSAADGND